MEADPSLALFKELEAIKSQLNAILEAQISQLKEDFSKVVDKEVGGVLERVVEVEKQPGPKGDKPVAGVDYPIPENGKNYILTETDKQEIANKIAVPIVEKIVVEKRTEVVKEQPIITNLVTNEVKEVAIAETAEVIANKLNTLEEAVERKVIKGLEKELLYLSKRVSEIARRRGGGGGVGNIQNETFTGDGVTTSFTLSETPKTNSLLVFYNGEILKPTTHYTISGKKLSLTATPLDELSIWVWYIRG